MGRRLVFGLVAGLLAIQAALLTYSAKVHSPTWDEVGHLAAGISHWELGRFELYSVNPPLVRTIAAAPVAAFSAPEMDWNYYRKDPSLRSEVFLGRRMIEINGKEDSYQDFFLARMAVIPIALLGGWFCFLWAKDLFGVVAGLVALTLWTFSPSVLAYGSVITPDLGSAVALLGSSYVFWRWLKDPGWSWALLMAFAFGLAMLTKSVWVALPVLLGSIACVHFVMRGIREHAKALQREKTIEADEPADTDKPVAAKQALPKRRRPVTSASVPAADMPAPKKRPVLWQTPVFWKPMLQFSVASLLALTMLNGFYGFEGTFRPLGEFTFVSERFASDAVMPEIDENCEDCGDPVPSVLPGNRFAGGPLAWVPLPLPANFVQGIDVQSRDFERGQYDSGWKSFYGGQWRQGGWWFFYLAGLFYKVPLSVWCLAGLGTVVAIGLAKQTKLDRGSMLGLLALWVPALFLLIVLSSVTGVTRYVRYALPVLPVLFIWGSQVGRLLEKHIDSKQQTSSDSAWARLLAVPSLLCVLALVGTGLMHTPNHLSYFNLAAGGVEGGYRHLTDSNVDWGQDLTKLETWLADHPEAAEDLRLAYFGAFDPSTVGIEYKLPPPLHADASTRRQADQLWMGPQPGWYVLSKNYVAGHPMPVPDGTDSLRFKFFGEPVYDYFQAFEPVDRIGGSMLVYHLKPDQVLAYRKQHGIAPLPGSAVTSSTAVLAKAARGQPDDTTKVRTVAMKPPIAD